MILSLSFQGIPGVDLDRGNDTLSHSWKGYNPGLYVIICDTLSASNVLAASVNINYIPIHVQYS